MPAGVYSTKTTRGVPVVIAYTEAKRSSADRVRRHRERLRGRGSPVVVGDELLGYTKPAERRRSGPSIVHTPELLSRRVFQAIVSEIFRKTSAGSLFPRG